MNYIENIYICLAAPLIVSIFCLNTYRRRMILLLLSGMTMCLLSSYISTFVASAYGMPVELIAIEVSPMVEEIMKILPVLFYLLVFEPKWSWVVGSSITVSIGFATFENVCYLLRNDTSNIQYLIIRGFGTGTMHVVTGMIVMFGMQVVWEKLWLRLAGTLALLSISVVFHAVYNILVSHPGVPAYVGYFVPIATACVTLIIKKRADKHKETETKPDQFSE